MQYQEISTRNVGTLAVFNTNKGTAKVKGNIYGTFYNLEYPDRETAQIKFDKLVSRIKV